MRRAQSVCTTVVLGLLLAAPAVTVGTAAAATAVPYSDPSAVGSIGLCNQSGQQITSGNVDTTPFAWRAVSTQPAQAPYNNTGRTAVLVAFQPQQELPPGDWSGEQLTASSRYSNPTNPMAAATDGDDSLEDFIQDYPPKWDGFVELRIYLGTDNEPSYQEKYPVLNVQVTGDTWHAVGGGQVNCSSGTAESIESVLLPTSTTTKAPSAAAGSTGAGSTSGGPTDGARSPAKASGGATGGKTGGSAGSTPTGSGGDRKAAGATQGTGSTSSVGLVVGIAAAVVVVLAAAWFLLTRRRRASRPGPTVGPGGPESGPDLQSDPDPGAGSHPDLGAEPTSDLEVVIRQKASTKGEPR